MTKQLLDETALPITDVALAAGYSSVRRFNDAVQQTYGRTPSQLRQGSLKSPEIQLKLPYTAPYHWPALLAFWGKRAIPCVETVTADCYRRTIRWLSTTGRPMGWVEIHPAEDRETQPYLLARIVIDDVRLLAPIVERLRQMLDVQAPITEIQAHLSQDPLLAGVVAQHPGLRVPGAWDPFEMAVRAILGQQISVAAATTIAGRLTHAFGDRLPAQATLAPPRLERLFPTADQLAALDPTQLNQMGISKARALAIVRLAETVVSEPDLLTQQASLSDTVQTLCQLPGIGEWIAQVIAIKQLEVYAQHWRPWRAYAAMHLWATPPANLSPLSA
ncbi:MAG: AlkA N-terminal domain-containing protein [Thermostichus sp. DG02_5_bins_236]